MTLSSAGCFVFTSSLGIVAANFSAACLFLKHEKKPSSTPPRWRYSPISSAVLNTRHTSRVFEAVGQVSSSPSAPNAVKRCGLSSTARRIFCRASTRSATVAG